jgi:hypothetical protein
VTISFTSFELVEHYFLVVLMQLSDIRWSGRNMPRYVELKWKLHKVSYVLAMYQQPWFTFERQLSRKTYALWTWFYQRYCSETTSKRWQQSRCEFPWVLVRRGQWVHLSVTLFVAVLTNGGCVFFYFFIRIRI